MTRAFVIEGTMVAGNGFTNMVGIAFFPDTLKTLTANMLENMGFRSARRDRSLKFEVVTTNGGAPPEPTLYFFDRSTSNRIVYVAKLHADGIKAETRTIALGRQAPHPRYVIPAIAGSAAVRFGLADAANAPGTGDFHGPKGLQALQPRRRPVFAQ